MAWDGASSITVRKDVCMLYVACMYNDAPFILGHFTMEDEIGAQSFYNVNRLVNTREEHDLCRTRVGCNALCL